MHLKHIVIVRGCIEHFHHPSASFVVNLSISMWLCNLLRQIKRFSVALISNYESVPCIRTTRAYLRTASARCGWPIAVAVGRRYSPELLTTRRNPRGRFGRRAPTSPDCRRPRSVAFPGYCRERANSSKHPNSVSLQRLAQHRHG